MQGDTWKRIRKYKSYSSGGVGCGVGEIFRSHESQSTTRPSDLGRQAEEIHEFGEKVFRKETKVEVAIFSKHEVSKGLV
jgi:hypothetical protein